MALAASPAPPAQPPGAPADTSPLDQYFTSSDWLADYIFVIDRSLAMEPYWPATAAAVSDFLNAIPEGDYAAFVTYDRRASDEFIAARVLNPGARSSLLAVIDNLRPSPRLLMDDDRNYADIGEALAKTLDQMGRSGANPLTYVFLLTDFAHRPHAGSPYGGPDTGLPAWQALRERGRKLREGRGLRCFALVLAPEGHAGKGLSAVQDVLGDLPAVPMNAGTLSPWFDGLAQQLHVNKLTMLVRTDLARGWEWSVNTAGGETMLSIHSKLERLPANVTLESASIEKRRVAIVGPRSQLLNPGTTVAFPLQVATCPDRIPWWRWMLTTGGVDVVDGQVDVVAEINFDHPAELFELRAIPKWPITTPVTGRVPRPVCGAPLWLQVLAVLGIVAVLAFVWAVWLRPARRMR